MRRGRADEPLTDRSSRPHSGCATDEATRDQILALRQQWWTVRQIAPWVGVNRTTARICRAAGLSRLRHLEPPPVPVRYSPRRAPIGEGCLFSERLVLPESFGL
jgi:hypothetical protein